MNGARRLAGRQSFDDEVKVPVGIVTRINGAVLPTCRCPTSTSGRGTSGGSTTTFATARSPPCAARRRSRFHESFVRRGVRPGPRALGGDPLRRRVLRQPSSRDLQLGRGHHDRRPDPRTRRVLRLDDRDGRPATHPAAQHRPQRLHPAGAGARRGLGARPGPAPGRGDGGRPSRRQGRARRRRWPVPCPCRSSAT